MPYLGHVVNAFRPATEMEDPRLFAGRKKEIRALVQALHSQGACPVIYGERGLGKSSLALQGEWIAAGDTQLLEQYGMLGWAFTETEHLLPVYLNCADDTHNTIDVLQRAINALSTAATLGSPPSVRMTERTETLKVSLLKVFEAEEVNKFVQEPGAHSIANVTQGEILIELANKIASDTGHPVLIIIDELDRVDDTSGLGAFIKTASSPSLRFLLVGIAQNLSELLADHLSIERSCVPIPVPRMTSSELRSITERAEAYLRAVPDPRYRIVFSGEAKEALAEISDGFPWFVHVLGQDALTATLDRSGRSVSVPDIQQAVRDLANNRFAQQFSDLYRQAVRESPQREAVLRAFALAPAANIASADVFRVLRGKLDIANPNYFKAQLCRPEYGSVLAPAPFAGKGIVRFRNHVFRLYIGMRRSLADGVDYRVADAFGIAPSAVFSEAVGTRGRWS